VPTTGRWYNPFVKEAEMEGTTQVLEEKKATPGGAARLIRKVKRETRRKFSAEEKIRIILEGYRKEIAITDLCRREGISTAVYYSWLKQFMEGGKARLKGATLRGATRDEVVHLKQENNQLKQLVGEQTLELSLLKKNLL
jgi:transposase